MNNLKLITLISESHYNIPGKLTETIKFFQKKLKEIPKEFQDSAELNFYYDNYNETIHYEIFYQRPETQDEIKDREQEEETKKQNRIKHDLELLSELKKIYEKG